MPDTIRTIAEILVLFADNEEGAISEQDLRDFVVTAESLINARLATSLVSSFSVSIFDSVDAEEWRTALGLGAAAIRDVGTTLGTVAAGDHTHTGLSVQAAGTPSVRSLGTSSTEAAPGDHTHAGFIARGTDGSGSNAAGTATVIDSQVPTGNSAAGAVRLRSTVVGSSGSTPQTQFTAIDTAGGTTTFYGPTGNQIAQVQGTQLGGNITGRLACGAGGTGIACTGGSDLSFWRNSALVGNMSGHTLFPRTCVVQWSATDWTGGSSTLPTPDTGMARNAAGVVEVNSGTAGTLRDLTLRNVIPEGANGSKIGTTTTQKIGFWNATPVAQQVLATGAGATVDNVISFLQTLGLCKQS